MVDLCSFKSIQFYHIRQWPFKSKCLNFLSPVQVTSLRKAFTLCLSYLIFTKPFKIAHLFGIVLIFLALSWKIVWKPKKQESENQTETEPIMSSKSSPLSPWKWPRCHNYVYLGVNVCIMQAESYINLYWIMYTAGLMLERTYLHNMSKFY